MVSKALNLTFFGKTSIIPEVVLVQYETQEGSQSDLGKRIAIEHKAKLLSRFFPLYSWMVCISFLLHALICLCLPSARGKPWLKGNALDAEKVLFSLNQVDFTKKKVIISNLVALKECGAPNRKLNYPGCAR